MLPLIFFSENGVLIACVWCVVCIFSRYATGEPTPKLHIGKLIIVKV
jgi:hypothetical protein